MHKLVTMSDDDRDRTVDQFWEFVTDGLDVHPGYVERLRTLRPHLPEEPSTEQLEAWIELAEAVRDEEFRTALRNFFHRTFGTQQGRLMTSPEITARVERHRKLLLEARAAQQAGMSAGAQQARDLAEQIAADSGELISMMAGKPDLDRAPEFVRNANGAWSPANAPGLKLLTRYRSLVAMVNGTPRPDPDRDPERAAAVRAWMSAALRQAT
jgi:hypothetical protein